jgi:hypothetical protein
MLVVTAALAASAAPAGASCMPAVRWGDTTYVAAPDETAVPSAGAPLRGGVRPACNDAVVVGLDGRPLQPPEPDRPVALRRVRGMPAAVAVIADGRLYVVPACLERLTQRRKRSRHTPCE